MFDSVAFIAKDEVSLTLTPHLSIRHRQLRLESTISVVDCEFERSVGCEPFTLCSLQTFSALYANFAEFNEDAWIRPETALDDLRRALTPYLDLIARYPRTRKA